MKSKIEYAYWIVEACRTDESRLESRRLFSECAKEIDSSHTGNDELKEYCSYLHIKTLVRCISSAAKSGQSGDWVPEAIHSVFSQLTVLATSSKTHWKGFMWLWLAEIQAINIAPFGHQIDMCKEIDEFRHLTGETQADSPVSCLNHAHEEFNKLGEDGARRFLPRFAKICAQLGNNQVDRKIREYFYQMALDKSESYVKWYQSIESHEWYPMAVYTATYAAINLWATDFYLRHKALVDQSFKHVQRREIGKLRSYAVEEISSPSHQLCTFNIQVLGNCLLSTIRFIFRLPA